MKNMKTISVAELIELLEEQDPDARVLFTADYGDHCHTAQALPITGSIDNLKSEGLCIAESAYSTSRFAIVEDDEDEDDEDEDDDTTYLVIR